MAEKKVIPKKERRDFSTITLKVPNPLYFGVKSDADKDTLEHGQKTTIHDKMIELIEKGRGKSK